MDQRIEKRQTEIMIFSSIRKLSKKRKSIEYKKDCIGLRYRFKTKTNERYYNLSFRLQAAITNLPVIYRAFIPNVYI